jgi:beta-glucosidase 2, glycosyl-hydrolase family 116 N-term
MFFFEKQKEGIRRRDFLLLSAGTVGALGTAGLNAAASSSEETKDSGQPLRARDGSNYNSPYSGERLSRVAFPMGGMGAGMICLEGSGALSHFSLRNRPEVFNEPMSFAALCVKGSSNVARVLEGPVPGWKKYGEPGDGNGASGSSFGLPRFRAATFTARFPFATVALHDPYVPLAVEILGWSPFEPGDPDNASLPVVGLEYRFTNQSSQTQEAVFSWSARNFMVVGQNTGAVKPAPGGFMLWGGAPADKPWDEGAFSATVDDPTVRVDHAWFRGGWWRGRKLPKAMPPGNRR